MQIEKRTQLNLDVNKLKLDQNVGYFDGGSFIVDDKNLDVDYSIIHDRGSISVRGQFDTLAIVYDDQSNNLTTIVLSVMFQTDWLKGIFLMGEGAVVKLTADDLVNINLTVPITFKQTHPELTNNLNDYLKKHSTEVFKKIVVYVEVSEVKSLY